MAPRIKKEPYACPCCGYQTEKKTFMMNHLYTLRKPCPKLNNDIELTEETKQYILANRILKVETTNQVVKMLRQKNVELTNELRRSLNAKENQDDTSHGMIYLIREREFLKLNETVIKIGRTQNISRRFGEYPKGSTLMFVTPCKNEIEVEKELIEIFKSRFEQRKDIGTEYFCGDVIEMSNCISVHISKINQSCE